MNFQLILYGPSSCFGGVLSSELILYSASNQAPRSISLHLSEQKGKYLPAPVFLSQPQIFAMARVLRHVGHRGLIYLYTERSYKRYFESMLKFKPNDFLHRAGSIWAICDEGIKILPQLVAAFAVFFSDLLPLDDLPFFDHCGILNAVPRPRTCLEAGLCY